MRLLPSLLAASLLLALSTNLAHAGGPPGTVTAVEPNIEPATPTRTVRYGKQIVVADLAWLGATALIGSIADGSGGEGVGSLVGLGYFATGPLVHLKNHNNRGAAKSLAARALLPAGGMLIGGLIASSNDQDDPTDDEWDELGDSLDVIAGMVLGGMVGMVSAVVLDWTTFSKKTVEGRPARWTMAPNLKMSKHSASVGVTGKF